MRGAVTVVGVDMVRLLLLSLFVGVCSPVLARACPAGTVRIREECVPLPAGDLFGRRPSPFSRPGSAGQGGAGGASGFYGVVGGGGGGGGGASAPSYDEGTGARALGGSRRFGASRLFPVRAYLAFDDIPPPGIGAYGVVVLRARPTDVDRARLRLACSAFTATLAKQSELPASIAPGEQMLTVWPLDRPEDPRASNDDCDFVLDTYALPAGDQAVADATRQGYSFSGRGPYLVGWSPSDTRGVKDKLALVVDMSGFDSQDSFSKSFLFWKQKVVEDPALWKHGFSVERFRLSLRDFADHYGQAFLDTIRLVGSK